MKTMLETVKQKKTKMKLYIESTLVYTNIKTKISWVKNKIDNFYLFINNPQHLPKLILILILLLLALYHNENNLDAVKELVNELYWFLVSPIMYLIFKEKIDLNTKKDCLLTIIFVLCILMEPFLSYYDYLLEVLIIFMLIFFGKILNDSFIGEFFERFMIRFKYFIRGLIFIYLICYHPIYSQVLFGVLPGTYVVKITSNPSATKAIITTAFCFAAYEFLKSIIKQ